MSLGLVTKDKLDNELSELSIPTKRAPAVIEKEIVRGRGDKKEHSETLRKLVAQEAILGTPHKVIREEFGVSQSSISAYLKGATSTATIDKPDAKLLENNNATRELVTGRAFDKLVKAIESIDEYKLSELSPVKAAQVAGQMSSIIKNVAPTNEEQVQIGQVIIYKPRMKQEDEYEIIDVQKIEK